MIKNKNSHIEVLIVCESSGVVRNAFRKQGLNAWSCDILPADDKSPYHIKGDMFDAIEKHKTTIKLLICHPPCTYLCSSGLHWNKRIPGRQDKTDAALRDIERLLSYDIPFIALENPVGCISTKIQKASQYIQPYQFGHNASKKTGLWLKNLPLLKGTDDVAPRIVKGKKRWDNQTDSGQNKLGPSQDRWKERSKTYAGIANAMAQQWAPLLK